MDHEGGGSGSGPVGLCLSTPGGSCTSIRHDGSLKDERRGNGLRFGMMQILEAGRHLEGGAILISHQILDLRNEIVDVEFSVKTRTGDVRRVGKSLEGEEGTGRPGRVRRAARSVWSEEGELHYVGDEARARDVVGVRSSVRPPSGCRQRQSDRWGREAHERRLWQDERRVGRGKDGGGGGKKKKEMRRGGVTPSVT
ncbi:hypothetical protein FB45DRAFT_1012995 [Roridomyces roridus]|uniref:Uncharacterized protein n=1 Tax=Roridomyces roridus TaxID=1738132 RepID=A0AAD7F9A1_9AGAR|nr:hypothetical protein FB45DRAFT_1012995 [Roridomyces roridus]